MSTNVGRRIRWWPAVLVLALCALAEAWVWLRPGPIRQMRVIETFIVSFVGVLLLLLWFLFFSRARPLWRWLALAAVGVAAVFFSQFVTISGVTGDLVPILGWKGGGSGGGGEVALAGGPGAAGAGGYPQFLGPRRDGTVRGVRLARDWETSPPREVWRRPVGEGWSGFAIAGQRAVTQEQHGPEERLVAYDLATGEELWHQAQPARYETTIGGIGPRATPTIAAGRVFALGATGVLTAVDLETGELFWRRDVLAEHEATNPEWGKSCSPLVVDGRVVVSAGGVSGGSLVAYDAETGELAWAAGSDRSSYSSPVLAELAGTRQIVIMNAGSFAGHDPATGEMLWDHPWPADQPNVAVPLLLPGDRILGSSGYGIGAKLLALSADGGADGDGGDDGLRASMVWESPRLKAKFTNPVLHEGYVYGHDDGVYVCLDPATGERCWKRGRYGHGQTILAGDLLLVTTEKGDVVLIDPSPEEHRELGRFSALSGKLWNPPALAGNYLALRTDREAVLYELPTAE